jgi:hypothetical protein
LVPNDVALPGEVHEMPKNPENVLPKFDPNKKESFEEHFKTFMLVAKLINLQHEDVIYRIFPYTFENKASTWYFSLAQASINSCNSFETNFKEKFGEDKNPTNLVLDLSRIKMEAK